MENSEKESQTMNSQSDIDLDLNSSCDDSGLETMSSGSDDDNCNSTNDPLGKGSQATSPEGDPYAGVESDDWLKGFITDSEKIRKVDPRPYRGDLSDAQYDAFFVHLEDSDIKNYPINLFNAGDRVYQMLIKDRGTSREELEKRPISPIEGHVRYWFKEAILPVFPMFGSKEGSKSEEREEREE